MAISSERLFIIPYLSWPREGLLTYEAQRAQLLDDLTRILLELDNDSPNPLKLIVLAGQTSLIQAISDIRPDLPALLAIYNASGRVAMGPPYTALDDSWAGGEAWIWNFLLGQLDAERAGLQLGTAVFMPQWVGDAPQLPQILRGFGLNALYTSAHGAAPPIPFRWVAPDDSSVLVIPYYQGEDYQADINRQNEAQPDGPLLWMAPADPSQLLPPAGQRSLADYTAALRDYLPDSLRPKVHGTLLEVLKLENVVGRLSARLPLKRINARQEAELTQQVQPLAALALAHLANDDNLRGWLEYAWRALLNNQSAAALGLCGDRTADDVLARARRLDDVLAHLRHSALAALPARHSRRASVTERTYIVVWNLSGILTESVVELPLDIPPDRHPSALSAPDGEAQMFGWDPDKRVFSFRAVVPPVGFAVYTVDLGDTLPDSAHLPHTLPSHIIGNIFGETLVVEGERLIWKRAKAWLNNVLRFQDGGDAGDLYAYRKPARDTVVAGILSDVVQTEVAALYERLIIHHRMRIAPALGADGVRGRGIRLLDLRTTATFYDNMPGIYFHTMFTNNADDHRLRAIIQTGIGEPALFRGSAYGFKSGAGSGFRDIVVAADELNAMALLTRGLAEAEAIRDAAQTSLALTVLRAVGWLDRRQGIPARGAQSHGEHHAEYALIPVAPNDPVGWFREAAHYQQPLLAYQSDDRPTFPAMSYLQLDGHAIVLTTLKPPRQGRGWVIRLFNPTSDKAEVALTPQAKLTLAHLLNMAEAPQAEFEIVRNSIRVRLDPYQIATIRLEFGG